MLKNGLRLFIVLLLLLLLLLIFQTFLSNVYHIMNVSMDSLRNQNFKNENTFGATKISW